METISAPDLVALKLPKQTSLVGEKLMVVNGRLVVYGSPEVYKSFLVQQLLFALAEGVDWFGHTVHAAVPTLYVQLEVPMGVFRERVVAMTKFVGRPGQVAYYNVSYEFRIDGEGPVDELVQAVQRTGAMAVMLDPLNLIMVGSENDDRAVRALVQALDHVRSETKALVGFVHHSNKGVFYEGQRVDTGLGKLSGSKNIAAWTDTALLVRRVEGFSNVVELVWEKVRHGARPERQWLRFDEDAMVLVPAENEPKNVLISAVADGPITLEDATQLLKRESGIGVNAARTLWTKLDRDGKIAIKRDPQNRRRRLLTKV